MVTCSVAVASPVATLVSSQAEVWQKDFEEGSIGYFRMWFDIIAISGDVYVPRLSARPSPLLQYSFFNFATPGVGSPMMAFLSTSSSPSDGQDFYLIAEGEKRRFHVGAMLEPRLSGYYALQLERLSWSSDPSAVGNWLEFGADEFRTNLIFLRGSGLPEPTSLVLLGLAAPLCARRRRKT